MSLTLRKFGLPCVLAGLCLLLLGQSGAQWHSYAHTDARQHVVTRAPALISHSPCDECLSFSALLSATGAPVAAISRLTPRSSGTPAAQAASLLACRITLAFRSRAPPR